MIISPFLAVSFIMKAVAVLFVISSIILVLVILIQKGKGGGLSSAFGGATASGILGSKTGDFLTWFTIILVGIFLFLAGVMAKFYRPTVSEFDTEQATKQESTEGSKPPAPTASTEANTANVNKSVDVNAKN